MDSNLGFKGTWVRNKLTMNAMASVIGNKRGRLEEGCQNSLDGYSYCVVETGS